MASFRSTKLKITIGYILLLAILLFFSGVCASGDGDAVGCGRSAESADRQSAESSP